MFYFYMIGTLICCVAGLTLALMDRGSDADKTILSGLLLNVAAMVGELAVRFFNRKRKGG